MEPDPGRLRARRVLTAVARRTARGCATTPSRPACSVRVRTGQPDGRARALLIGVASPGGIIPSHWLPALVSALEAGFTRAFATIIDSNVTMLIAAIALFSLGSGPVRGFAVVHCLGILTSMFSAVFFSRGLVNLWYGRQKKLKSVSIGTVWRPTPDPLAVQAK